MSEGSMSLTKKAREQVLMNGLMDVDVCSTNMPIVNARCIEVTTRYLKAALDVVDAAKQIHVDFLLDNGAAITLADWRTLQEALDRFAELD